MMLKWCLCAAIFACIVWASNVDVLEQFDREIAGLRTHNTPLVFKTSTIKGVEVPTIFEPASVALKVHALRDAPPTILDLERRYDVKVFSYRQSHYIVTPSQYALLVDFQRYYRAQMGAREAGIFDSTFKEWLDYIILNKYGIANGMLNDPARAIQAIRTSERSGWSALDDAANRHLSWWDKEYQQAKAAGCRPPSRTRKLLDKVSTSVHSLLRSDYRHIRDDDDTCP